MSADVNDLLETTASAAVLHENAELAEKRGGVSVEPEVSGVQLAAEQEPIVPDEPRSEVERLEPEPTFLTLRSGLEVDVMPLRFRETLKLLQIITRGAGALLQNQLDTLDLEDGENFAQQLGMIVLFAIPEAPDQAVEFIQSMVLPKDYFELTDTDKVEKFNALAVEMADPDLHDVVSIVERVIRRESEDIRGLGKRIADALQLSRQRNLLSSN